MEQRLHLTTSELMAQSDIVRAIIESDLGEKAVVIDEIYTELVELGLDERAVRSSLWDILSYYPSLDARTIPQLETGQEAA